MTKMGVLKMIENIENDQVSLGKKILAENYINKLESLCETSDKIFIEAYKNSINNTKDNNSLCTFCDLKLACRLLRFDEMIA